MFGFFAVAFLSGSLAERARRGDAQLEQATEEIADLQVFNQYVIDNLVSGLATADAENRLLTFNRSAMLITGRDGALPIGESGGRGAAAAAGVRRQPVAGPGARPQQAHRLHVPACRPAASSISG